MSLGARIREERQRLGLNQTDFAAIAGASKRAMVSWEKDDSAPSATALIAWAERGADALFILSGQRQDKPFNQRAETDIQGTIDQLEEALNNPAIQQYEQGMTYAEVREGARLALEGIATSTSPDISEPARSRADDVIRAHFPDDKGAAKRRSARFASLMLRRQHADRDLADALAALDAELPRNLRHQLLMLVMDYQMDTKDVMPLLAEIQGAIQADR